MVGWSLPVVPVLLGPAPTGAMMAGRWSPGPCWCLPWKAPGTLGRLRAVGWRLSVQDHWPGPLEVCLHREEVSGHWQWVAGSLAATEGLALVAAAPGIAAIAGSSSTPAVDNPLAVEGNSYTFLGTGSGRIAAGCFAGESSRT